MWHFSPSDLALFHSAANKHTGVEVVSRVLGLSIGWGQATYEHILTYIGSLQPMDLFWHMLTAGNTKNQVKSFSFSLSVVVHPVISMSLSYKSSVWPSVVSKSFLSHVCDLPDISLVCRTLIIFLVLLFSGLMLEVSWFLQSTGKDGVVEFPPIMVVVDGRRAPDTVGTITVIWRNNLAIKGSRRLLFPHPWPYLACWLITIRIKKKGWRILLSLECIFYWDNHMCLVSS